MEKKAHKTYKLDNFQRMENEEKILTSRYAEEKKYERKHKIMIS